MRISLGVIIAVILVFFWYKHDHPDTVAVPVAKQTLNYSMTLNRAA